VALGSADPDGLGVVYFGGESLAGVKEVFRGATTPNEEAVIPDGEELFLTIAIPVRQISGKGRTPYALIWTIGIPRAGEESQIVVSAIWGIKGSHKVRRAVPIPIGEHLRPIEARGCCEALYGVVIHA
jgi:hypothetical protein